MSLLRLRYRMQERGPTERMQIWRKTPTVRSFISCLQRTG